MYIWAGVLLVNSLIYIIYTFIDTHMYIYDKRTIVSHILKIDYRDVEKYIFTDDRWIDFIHSWYNS